MFRVRTKRGGVANAARRSSRQPQAASIWDAPVATSANPIAWFEPVGRRRV
jgi:hypothetical protein